MVGPIELQSLLLPILGLSHFSSFVKCYLGHVLFHILKYLILLLYIVLSTWPKQTNPNV